MQHQARKEPARIRFSDEYFNRAGRYSGRKYPFFHQSHWPPREERASLPWCNIRVPSDYCGFIAKGPLRQSFVAYWRSGLILGFLAPIAKWWNSIQLRGLAFMS